MTAAGATGEVAVAAALSAVGRPYAYGAPAGDTDAFDCSSLVQWAWGLAGVDMPRASIDQFQALARSRLDDLRPGDLVFYDNALPNGPPYRGVNHVVMWIGGGRVVEASSLAGGVRVIPLAAKGRALGACRPGVGWDAPAWRYSIERAVAFAGERVVARGDLEGRAAAIAATPSGRGYWVVAAHGRVVPFGDAEFLGDVHCAAAAMAATPSGRGYWVADVTGRVSAFGDAQHVGDAEGACVVTAMAATRAGDGYWLLDATGRVSAFGGAAGLGDGVCVDAPLVGIAPTPSGLGYWVVDAAGRASAFGDAGPRLSPAGDAPASDEPVVAMEATAAGYRLLDAGGRILAFELEGVAP